MSVLETLQERGGSSSEASPTDDVVPDLIAPISIPSTTPNQSQPTNTKTNQSQPSNARRKNSILRKFSIGNIGLFQHKVLTEDTDVVTLRDIQRARNRVMDYIHQTDIITSSNLDSMLKIKVIFKAECFQKSGTYRVRGLLNHILHLREMRYQKKVKSRKSSLPQNFAVMTYRAGEFAEAGACAANMLGVKCASVVPKSTCQTTLQILKHYKSAVLVNPSDSRGTLLRRAEKEAQDTEYKIIHPYEPSIIAGYGTLATDFMKQTNNTLEAILVYAGDGCLSAATAIAVKQINSSTDVYLVTQKDDSLQLAMATSTFQDECVERALTSIAPALNLSVHPTTRSALIKHCEKCVLTVDNNAIIDAMKFIFERLKIVIDENAAACVAGLFTDTFMFICQEKKYRRVGVMLTGGNTDLTSLPFVTHDVYGNTKCRNT